MLLSQHDFRVFRRSFYNVSKNAETGVNFRWGLRSSDWREVHDGLFWSSCSCGKALRCLKSLSCCCMNPQRSSQRVERVSGDWSATAPWSGWSQLCAKQNRAAPDLNIPYTVFHCRFEALWAHSLSCSS